MTSERRTQKRFNVCLDAIWDGARGNARVRVADLSEGGCYIDSICQTMQGETLHLKLQLPNGEWLDLVGEVAHSFARVGFGLRFIDMDNEQVQKLRQMLRLLKESDEQPALRLCS